MNAGVKQAYHHKDLRNALIDEALTVLASAGSGELTLRELARRLGVTHAAPYAHFADKNALLEAVSNEGFARLADRLEAAERASGDPGETLLAMGGAYFAFARENPNLYRLMFADAALADDPECELSPGGERAFATLTNALARVGVPKDVDARDLSAAVWSLVHGAAMLELDHRMSGKTMRSADEVLRLGSRLMLAGLRACHGVDG